MDIIRIAIAIVLNQVCSFKVPELLGAQKTLENIGVFQVLAIISQNLKTYPIGTVHPKEKENRRVNLSGVSMV